MLTFIKYNRNALLWAFLILGLCSMPVKGIPNFSLLSLFSLDKVAHMVLFGTQFWLLATGLQKQYATKLSRVQIVVISFTASAVYGALIELMQGYLLSGRSMDIGDAIANVIGCILGSIAFVFVYRSKSKKVN